MIVSGYPSEYVVLDTETTGLPVKGDWSSVYLVSIAVVPVHSERPEYCELVQLPDGVQIPPEAAAINQLTTQECNENGVPVCDALCDAISACGHLPIVGQYVIGFDLALLMDIADRLEDRVSKGHLELRASVSTFDTKLIWKAHKLGLKRNKHEPLAHFWGRVQMAGYWGGCKLEQIAQDLRVILPGESQIHSAYDDCVLVADVFEHMRQCGIVEEVLGQ